jgi:type VI secretion system protein ImpG
MIADSQEDLLRYYKTELTYLRQMGGVFADRYPKIAKRLELGRDECADPQVERLIEAFAFLTARLQHEIDSEFPDITNALLDILYPQLSNPIPSMAIAQFNVDPAQKLTTGHLIEKETPLFADAADGVSCRFRTCYPVTLWPLRVAEAEFGNTRRWNFLDADTKVACVLRLKLQCLPAGSTFQELEGLNRLRFYLSGEPLAIKTIYERLFCHLENVAIQVPSRTDENGREGEQNIPNAPPRYLGAESIKEVGFGLDNDVLPYPPNAHPGYMLLQEYFAFPKQYFFFDLCFDQNSPPGATGTLLDSLDLKEKTRDLDILFLLTRPPRESLVVDEKTFCLGCTPIINLFHKTTEPIRLDHRSLEYPLVPDKRRERTTEIHSIVSVSASSNADDKITQQLEPFYSYNHRMQAANHTAFWHARRVASQQKDMRGTDMLLSFLDLDLKPRLPAMQTVYAHTLCTNRELARQLPAGAALQIEQAAPLDKRWPIVCLEKPSKPLSPPLKGATSWRLISHLSLNHLSLSEDKDSLAALKEILRLYCAPDNHFHQQLIEGICQMKCRRVVRHIGDEPWRGFCRGTEVTLKFDEDYYEGSGAFLFGAVLNRFFASYASVNSFTQLIIESKQREGTWWEWKPMAGELVIM